MFGKWLEAKGRADEETAEVVASRHILERCLLQRRFQEWRLATQRALTIRPLVMRRERQLVTWLVSSASPFKVFTSLWCHGFSKVTVLKCRLQNLLSFFILFKYLLLGMQEVANAFHCKNMQGTANAI